MQSTSNMHYPTIMNRIDPEQAKKDYISVLDTLCITYLSNTGEDLPYRYVPLEEIIKKIIFHAFSLIDILTIKRISLTNNSNFYVNDFSGAVILIRAILESYLTIFWTSFQPESDYESEERIILWSLLDITKRIHSVINCGWDISLSKKDKEKRFLLLLKIYQNDHFLKRNEETQNEVLYSIMKKEKIPLSIKSTWSKLITESNISKKYSDQYKFMCSHSHSGYISASQVHFWTQEAKKTNMDTYCYIILTPILAKLTFDIMCKFTKSKQYLLSEEKRLEKILFYSNVACRF